MFFFCCVLHRWGEKAGGGSLQQCHWFLVRWWQEIAPGAYIMTSVLIQLTLTWLQVKEEMMPELFLQLLLALFTHCTDMKSVVWNCSWCLCVLLWDVKQNGTCIVLVMTAALTKEEFCFARYYPGRIQVCLEFHSEHQWKKRRDKKKLCLPVILFIECNWGWGGGALAKPDNSMIYVHMIYYHVILFLSLTGGAFVATAEKRNRYPSLRLAAAVERNHWDSLFWGTHQGMHGLKV